LFIHKEREAGDPYGSPMERDKVIGSKRISNAALTSETLHKKTGRLKEPACVQVKYDYQINSD